MPRYFFDTKDGGMAVHDDTGTELADPAAMRREAMRVLPSMAADELDGLDHYVFVVRVRDEEDSIVFHASLTMVADWFD